MKELMDGSALDEESARLGAECEVVLELIGKCVNENANEAINQNDYQKRYDALAARYQAAKARLGEIATLMQTRKAKHEQMEIFLKHVSESGAILAEFDEDLWHATVDTITVNSAAEVIFRFKDGTDFTWEN